MSESNSAPGSRAGSAEPAEKVDNNRHDSPIQEDNENEAGNASDHERDHDRDSDLSEIDEDQFEDYDPTREERPVEIDESVAMKLKAAKRKRTEGETVKKPKEGRRPKKRSRPADEEGAEGGDEERRPRKARSAGERRSAKKDSDEEEEEVNEENLTPEERRRRAISRAMDEALKNKTKRRRKKDEIVSVLDRSTDGHMSANFS
jgi:transcription factor SPN1